MPQSLRVRQGDAPRLPVKPSTLGRQVVFLPAIKTNRRALEKFINERSSENGHQKKWLTAFE
jgi:hypothetical protein